MMIWQDFDFDSDRLYYFKRRDRQGRARAHYQ